MTLLLLILSIVVFSFLANYLKKYYKIFILISILSVFVFYFFISKTFFQKENFYPNSTIQTYSPCGNFYNLLVNSLKQKKLNICEDINIPIDKQKNIYSKYDDSLYNLLDTSYYKGKIYLYFGITPVLLFYLPFNLITSLYLTDDFLLFFLSFFIFILSLILVYKISSTIIDIKKIDLNIFILTIFLIGFCNLIPFILIHGFIHQVVISTAILLILLSFYLFFFYIQTNNTKKQKIILFLLSFTLCLSVGARPHYVLFIPIFLLVILYIKYKQQKNIKSTLKILIIFLIPCFIYGLILALYNYMRFESIFEFGFKYQLNPSNLYNHTLKLNDFFLAIKNDFFLLPNMNEVTFFSLSKTYGHSLGNEHIVGIVWTSPIILILLFIPNIMKNFINTNKKIFLFIIVILSTIFINIFVTSFVGIVIRYIFEYISIMIILSIIIFYYLYSKIENSILKKYINMLFTVIFIYSMFINISLLFCKENFYLRPILYSTLYSKVINFLF